MNHLIVFLTLLTAQSADVAALFLFGDLGSCNYNFGTALWGDCSDDCGGGFQIRILERDAVAEPSDCPPLPQARICNIHPCQDECRGAPVVVDTYRAVPDPFDCRCFHRCSRFGNYYKTDRFCCPACTTFNPDICNCDYPNCDQCADGYLMLITQNDTKILSDSVSGLLHNPTEAVFASAGATWTIEIDGDDPLEVVGNDLFTYFFGSVNVTSVTKQWKTVELDYVPWSEWTPCLPDCPPLNMTFQGRRWRHRAQEVLNWCSDASCPGQEEREFCESPVEFCPTEGPPPECPCDFHLKFEDNFKDEFGAWVGEAFDSVLDYMDGPTGYGKAGWFDQTTLQVELFNNWHSDRNRREFIMAFWLNVTNASVHQGVVTNECDAKDPTIVVWVENNAINVQAQARVTGLCDTVTASITDATWEHFEIRYNGKRLELFKNCNLESWSSCRGGIKNQKCPMMIGSDLHGKYLDGYLDEFKIFRHANMTNIVDCPCPPSGP